MGLQRFEQGLERMVEGVFSRSSRSTIRPVELGRRLLREMDDHRSVDAKGRRIVPNSFTFHLSARDHSGFAEIEHALVAELTEAAREYAADEGYHLLGPLSVALLVDNNLKPGRFGIASVLRETTPQAHRPVFPPIDSPSTPAEPVVPPLERVVSIPEAAPDHSPGRAQDLDSDDGAGLAALVAGAGLAGAAGAAAADAVDAGLPGVDEIPLGATEASDAIVSTTPDQLAAVRGTLVLPSGQRVEIRDRTISIGRLPECELTLSDPNVSRRHAEVRPIGNALVVVDLGSTNGTKVNGQRIPGEQRLDDGDIISVGATHLRYEAS